MAFPNEPIATGRLSIPVSRLKAAKLLALSTGFVALGGILVAEAHQPLVGWVTVAFFGLGIPIALRQLLDRRPRLVIDERGVFDRTLAVGVIPWSEIDRAYVRSMSGNDFVCLELRDPALFEHELGRVRRAIGSANRTLGFTTFLINAANLPVRADEILERIERGREAHRRGGDR